MNEQTISYAEYAWRTNKDGQLCPCQSCVNDRMFYAPPGYVQSENMFKRLKSGETLHVLARRTGKQFSIKPVEWEGLILGYSVLVDGEVVPGYDGLLLDTDTVKDWLNQVEEV